MSTESITLSFTSLTWWTWASLGLIGIVLTVSVFMRHYLERTMPSAVPGILLILSIACLFTGIIVGIISLPSWGQWVMFAAASHLVANELQAPLARFMRDRAAQPAHRRFPVIRS